MGKFHMGKQRNPGNPNWGKRSVLALDAGCVANGQTQFEITVAGLGLNDEHEMTKSHALKDWVRRHKNKRYVPEWLLTFWGMEAEITYRALDRV